MEHTYHHGLHKETIHYSLEGKKKITYEYSHGYKYESVISENAKSVFGLIAVGTIWLIGGTIIAMTQKKPS